MNAPTPRILWAEDNSQDRTLIQASLEENAHPGVTLVHDGVLLLEALAKVSPNLVVLDLKMPRLGGLGALREIRAHPEWKSLPVVVFSSGERPDEIAACQALGVKDVVEKPVDFDLFVLAVQRVVSWAAPELAAHQTTTRSSGATP
jgi:two-component system, response regulator